MATKKPGGKVPRISKEKIQQMRQMLANTTKTVAQVAKELGVSKGTVYYQTGGKRKVLEIKAALAAEKVAGFRGDVNRRRKATAARVAA